MTTTSLLCRLNIFHKWRTVIAEDGNRSRRCAKCGKDDDGRTNDPQVGMGMNPGV